MEEPDFEGMASYLLNFETSLKLKIEGHKTKGKNLSVPVLRIADINKDGTEELIYVHPFDRGDYQIMEALVFNEEGKDGGLVERDDLSFA